MIDIHCHILPGVDDGARDWDTAVTRNPHTAIPQEFRSKMSHPPRGIL